MSHRIAPVPDFLSKPAPPNYVAGLGRGASGFAVATRADIGPSVAQTEPAFDQFRDPENETGLFNSGKFDQDDDEADRIYDMVDRKMQDRRKTQREAREKLELESQKNNKIQDQFKDLKRDLSTMSNDDWANIPDVVDMVRKRGSKKQRDEVYERNSAVPDTILLTNVAAASSNLDTVEKTNFEQFNKAKNQMLELQLDNIKDSISGQTTIDPLAYQNDLGNMVLKSDAEISDIKKARKLLRSVCTVNPKHAPGWLAAARLEEVSGNLKAARELIAQGCEHCPRNEDMWIELARLDDKEGKVILAQAVKQIPDSVNLWLKAHELEMDPKAKKKVLRKALENIPNSVQLWKATISAEENPQDAKLLLSKAVECIPSSVELWIAFAKLETGSNAQKILNRARVANPASHLIWLAAAKLMEKENQTERIGKVLEAAIRELTRIGSMPEKEVWIREAENCEDEKYLSTCNEIIIQTIAIDVEEEVLKSTLLEEAEKFTQSNHKECARFVYEYALSLMPTKKSIWRTYAFFEKDLGEKEKLLEILQRSVEECPKGQIFWLIYAKEMWMDGNVEMARHILKDAFEYHPDSEQLWLAAIKLEMETKNFDKAETLLADARIKASTAAVWMKSAVLYRILKKSSKALDLVNQAIEKYPQTLKLWIIKGQILLDDLNQFEEAKAHYELAVKKLSKSPILWVLYSRLEESKGNPIKSRAILEQARIMNPKCPEVWSEAVDVELRHNNVSMGKALLSKALQECPNSGNLWCKRIMTESRPQRKARATDALKKCENDPLVVTTVARLFWAERKIDKARNWFSRAVKADKDIGDCWAWWLKFEQAQGSKEQQDEVIQGCIQADPKHGIEWPMQTKSLENFGLNTKENLLDLTSKLDNKSVSL